MQWFKSKAVLLLPLGVLLSTSSEAGLELECVISTDDPGPGYCGCTDIFGDPVDCTPMVYDSCPDGTQPVTLGPAVDTPSYNGRAPAIASYVCVSGPVCDLTTANVLAVNGGDFVAEFVDHNTLNVYLVPSGTTKATSPSGRHLFPLLQQGAGFADPAKPVDFQYQGTPLRLFLDFQNDCFPTADGNCVCSTC